MDFPELRASHSQMQPLVRTLAWLLCVLYSTIPAFWLLIHPRAEYWRSRRQSPYRILLPLWVATWIAIAALTAPWRGISLYQKRWPWIPAALLFGAGLLLYKLSHAHFTLQQLGGLPELLPGHSQQRLITTGIRAPPPSRLSRSPLRDARLELRHRPCRLLGPDRIRNHHRRRHDQNGGSRTGKKIR
jgi:hypothetical protein